MSPSRGVLVVAEKSPGIYAGVNISGPPLAGLDARSTFGTVLWRNVWDNGLHIANAAAAFSPGASDLLIFNNRSGLVAVNGTTGVVLWSAELPENFPDDGDRRFALTRDGVAFLWIASSVPMSSLLGVAAYDLAASLPGRPAPRIANRTAGGVFSLRSVWASDDGATTFAHIGSGSSAQIVRASLSESSGEISFCGPQDAISACAVLPQTTAVFPGPAPASYAGLSSDGVLSLWKDSGAMLPMAATAAAAARRL